MIIEIKDERNDDSIEYDFKLITMIQIDKNIDIEKTPVFLFHLKSIQFSTCQFLVIFIHDSDISPPFISNRCT